MKTAISLKDFFSSTDWKQLLMSYSIIIISSLTNWKRLSINLYHSIVLQSRKTIPENKSQVKFPHLPIGKSVNRLYIYPTRRKDSTTLFLTRTTAHFPHGSIGKCFRKATNVSSILTETTISQQWDTNWKFLESGQSFSALRNFDRQRAPPLWRKLLRDIGSRRRFIWLQVKKKNFHARVSIPLPLIPQFFPLFDEESATFQLVNRLPLTFH